MEEETAVARIEEAVAAEEEAVVDSKEELDEASHEQSIVQKIYDLCATVLLPEIQRILPIVQTMSNNVHTILKYSENQKNMLQSLILEHAEFPLTPLFVAPPAPEGVHVLDPRRLYKQELLLYFICPVSGKLGNPYSVIVAREWLRKAAPFVKIAITIGMIAAATLSNLNLPACPYDYLDALTGIKETASLVQEELGHALEQGSYDLSAEARGALRELLSSIDSIPPSKSGLVRVVSEADGSVCWIHPSAVDSFQRYGQATFNLNVKMVH
jgi:hypothetical protein